MGKSGRLSGGCGLPPQYWGGGEQQRPGQRESDTVRSMHYVLNRSVRVTLLRQCYR